MRNVEQFPFSRGHSPRETLPEGMTGSRERDRLKAAAGGDPNATAEVVRSISSVVWKACRLFSKEEEQARETFLEMLAALSADRFARLCGYDGRSTLETFIALAVRELMAERMLRLINSDPERGWRAFEQLFKGDIERLIRRRLLKTASQDERDAYQEISLALIEGGYRRLKAYQGQGSFAGFVLKSVDRILIDRLRRETSRRRLPAVVQGMALLDQEVFKLIVWRGLPERPELLAPQLAARLGAAPEFADVAAAILRIRSLTAHGAVPVRLVSLDQLEDIEIPGAYSPEDDLLRSEEEEQTAAALDVLMKAAESLAEPERLYLTIALSASEPPPSREIARLMRLPVEDIYKLKQRVLDRLRAIVTKESAIKNWRVSV